MTRREAKAAGMKLYYTGKECANGHVDYRYVANWTCVQCDWVRKQGVNPAKLYRQRKARLLELAVTWSAALCDEAG